MADNGIRLLIVDDEKDLVTYMSKRFAREGFKVSSFTRGVEAIEAARTQVFDMAVVDLKMPEMDGVEVQRKLKELQPFLQVVVLTGHGSFDTALESGRTQAFRYLHKPYEFSGLLEILHEAYDVKRKAQREEFQRELKECVGDGASSPAILSRINDLRKKYELE
jgi:DNA-binding NtrC family response regulator